MLSASKSPTAVKPYNAYIGIGSNLRQSEPAQASVNLPRRQLIVIVFCSETINYTTGSGLLPFRQLHGCEFNCKTVGCAACIGIGSALGQIAS